MSCFYENTLIPSDFAFSSVSGSHSPNVDAASLRYSISSGFLSSIEAMAASSVTQSVLPSNKPVSFAVVGFMASSGFLPMDAVCTASTIPFTLNIDLYILLISTIVCARCLSFFPWYFLRLGPGIMPNRFFRVRLTTMGLWLSLYFARLRKVPSRSSNSLSGTWLYISSNWTGGYFSAISFTVSWSVTRPAHTSSVTLRYSVSCFSSIFPIPDVSRNHLSLFLRSCFFREPSPFPSSDSLVLAQP